MTRALWSQNTSHVDLLTALHDTARQEPELCGLVRQRYVDSLHQAVEGVLAHAVERGDLPPRRADPSGAHSIAVSAAITLLLHWGLARDRQVGDDDIAAIVDAVLMPLLWRPCAQRHRQAIDQARRGSDRCGFRPLREGVSVRVWRIECRRGEDGHGRTLAVGGEPRGTGG
jgi:hypothetical protein